ncbi:hypothetical protein H6F50_16550 [Coleofasciculus sp. FACHB-712]|uniref:hypothetical protein n=1 Tax=Coleofasciculus sp. FACHB-712 TaxID=2692789 RepID=UPI00168411D0|nr:hypothetical protein [Coleofasciculus sp. FACHB-712]MBD1943951.1 hypothetical protein [Coleofasciculus sp. FACHB-712]
MKREYFSQFTAQGVKELILAKLSNFKKQKQRSLSPIQVLEKIQARTGVWA